ncbi:MAG TPA: amino acid ABC transporter ATP-binding protein [Arachnia sp.]|nr:amino acid ABC transporter ATP-binding protein [Arachnia sp.]HMT87691.1 amino acid ABC transporter ATP-binding protein [Arachnia sp.]
MRSNAVEVQDLSKSFGDAPVFEGISFEVEKGSVTAVIGPSGGGKSTMLRCINRLERPDSGRIVVDGEVYEAGEKLSPERERALHKKVGMVFQRFHLFPHLTVLRNLTLGQEKVLGRPRRQAEDRARELLGMVGLADRGSAHPRELSGGQQQRVAIARALSLDPEILLFDEPTSALDPELGYEVLQVMKGLAHHGTTMIVVTHEMSFAEDVADQVLVLADHTLIESGDPAEVFANPAHERTRRFLDHVRRV